MIRVYLVLALAVFAAACSSDVNTARMTMDEHLAYAMSLYNDEDYQFALREFQSLTVQYPGSAINDDAQYYLGMTYFKKSQYLLAVYEFSKLIRDIPASPYVSESQYMLAESYYQLSPHPALDQEYTKKAIEEFQAFIDFFPTHEKVHEAEAKLKELNNKLAEKDYHSAQIYERMEYFNAAIKYYGLVAETYHDSEYAPLALYYRAQLLVQKDRDAEALNDIALYLSRYPDHEYVEEMKELEETLENK